MTTKPLPDHPLTTHDVIVKLGLRRRLFLIGGPLTVIVACLALAVHNSPGNVALSQLQEPASHPTWDDGPSVSDKTSHNTSAVLPSPTVLLDGPSFSRTVAQALDTHRSAILGTDNGSAFTQAVHEALDPDRQ